jgi:hypothetical protein
MVPNLIRWILEPIVDELGVDFVRIDLPSIVHSRI